MASVRKKGRVSRKLYDAIHRRVLEYLSKKPEKMDELRAILEYEVAWVKEHGREIEKAYAPTWKDVNEFHRGSMSITSRTYWMLQEAGIVEPGHTSAKVKSYTLIDREAVRDAISELERVEHGDEDTRLEVIPDDLFAPVVAHELAKTELLKCLRAPRANNTALFGPEATGKSIFGICIDRLKGARYELATNLTGPGMYDELIANPGLKYLVIDEIEKADTKLKRALLGFDTGRIDKTISGMSIHQNRDIWLIIMGNEKKGLPGPFLSRFSEHHLKQYTPEQAQMVMWKMLMLHEDAPESVAKQIALMLVDDDFYDPRRARDVWRKNGEDLDGARDSVQALVEMRED